MGTLEIVKLVLRLPWASPRRNGEAEIRNTKLAAIVANTDDAITSYTIDGIIISWNPAAERIYGYSADEMIGHSYSVLVPSELAHEAADNLEKIRKGHSILNYETVRLRKDGSAVTVSRTVSPIYDQAGAVIGGSTIARDLTEIKESEMRNALSAAIVAASNDAILSYSLDGFITSWNPAAERIFGYSADETIGQPFSVLVPSEKAGEVTDFPERLARGEKIANHETVRMRKDGSAVSISLTVSLIYDINGVVIGGSSVARDLTDLKDLETQRSLLAVIVESSSEAIWSYTLDGIITVWNPAAERILGYSADEMIGQIALDMFPSEKWDETSELIEKIRKGNSISNYETVRLRKDGSAVPVSLTVSPINDLTGAVIGGSTICRDMTELKKSEMRNALLAAIVASSNDAILSFDLDGVATSWNTGAERVFGYSADEIVGQPPLAFVHSEKSDESADILRKVRKGQLIEHFETVRLRKNGSAVPVSMNISPINDLSGAVIGASAIYRDITEVKILEMRNTLLAAIVASSNDAISSFSLDGIITSWNPSAERIFGYSVDEIIGQPSLVIVPAEKSKESADILEKIRKGQSVEHFDTVRLRKDGSTIPISKTVSPVYDSTGVVIGGSAISRDMTELKKSEVRNALLAAIVAASNDAIMSYTLDGIFTTWNPGAERIFGYSADEMIGQSFSVRVPSEKADEAASLLEMIRKGEPIVNFETVRLRKDKSAVPVSLTMSPIYDLTGALIGGSSITRDMTELKILEERTELLAIIVESSNDAIWSSGIDGIVTSWNPAAERLYGYSADEMIGQPFSVIVPSETEDETTRLRKLIAEGQPIENYEIERLRKDGNVVSVSLNISPIYDLSGAVVGASTITRDMTELKLAEQKFSDILESSPDAMVIADKTGVIKFVNSQTEEIFGYRREEILGQSVELLMPSRFRAIFPSYRDRFFSNPQVEIMGDGLQLYGDRKDGKEFPIEVRLSPVETADGVLVVATVRDVTDHIDMIRRLKEMDDLRNEFVAVVAHDLRSPMTSISGYAQELLNEWDATDDAKKIEYLQIIVRNTEHLAEFVEDVLQVARIEAGEYAYNIRPFDIRPLVQRALDETASASDGRRFEFTAPGDLPNVLGDEDRQWQVLTNLLSNAVKFSPADEPIVVGLSCIDDSVQVAVTDWGIGVATDDMSKLFTKFGRVGNSGVSKAPGNGLGLYICKTLVEAQGGRIWCESSPGRGSTFTFTIPIAR